MHKHLLRLRQQSWWAAVLLSSPWLLTTFLCWPLFRDRPGTGLALLPGLAVTIHLRYQLCRHLGANHRPGEENQLFPTLGVANWITLLRASAVVALAGFLPMAVQPPGLGLPAALTWTPGLIYLGISLADSGRIKIDSSQQSTMEHWAASRLGRTLPLMLRLIILAGGSMMFAAFGVYPTHPYWWLALIFCCLLAGLGLLGRSAGLGLTLLLGSQQSPFGMSITPMLLFAAAATLMLTGTGNMSLWSPEEVLLYRRPLRKR